MNLYQCENKAKDARVDKAKFWAVFPKGPIECQWLDPYFGLLKIEGMDGFVTTGQIDKMYPDLECSALYFDEES